MNIFEILIIQPVFNLLLGIYGIIPGGDFGIALIVFTILIRLLMWPLVKKQLHQVVVMRKIQPELAKIKKATKGNRQLEAMQMMELYKKHGVSPFRSIGIILLQLPIFIALFQVIRVFTSHRDEIAKFTYDFLEGFGPIKQIIDNPAAFNEKLFGAIDLTSSAVSDAGINIVLVLVALGAAYTQFLISKQTSPAQPNQKRLRDIMSEAAAGKQADQSDMNAAVMSKMVKILPIFMFFVMINFPGALSLYYMVSNIVAFFQQKRILDRDFKDMDKIADQKPKTKTGGKKATAKARAKIAKEANITRIVAKDNRRK